MKAVPVPTECPRLAICGDTSDTIYKRPTMSKGVVSGQQPPIKPPPPKL